MSEIANEIHEKLQTIANNVQTVYEAGKDAGTRTEREQFWDRFLHGGERGGFWGATGIFNGYSFGFDNFYPTCDIKPIGNAMQLFYAWENSRGDSKGSLKQRLEECGVILDTSQATNLTNAFSYSHITELPTIDCTGLVGESTNVFANTYGRMTTIEKIIVKEDTLFTKWFYNSNLINVAFEGTIGQDLDISYKEYRSTDSKLSADSIINIIEHLSLTATGKTLTLSKAAVDKAFEEGEGANNGSQTQEWEHWYGSKQNWTISLV